MTALVDSVLTLTLLLSLLNSNSFSPILIPLATFVAGAAKKYCIADGIEEFAATAKSVGTDSSIRGQVMDCIDEAKHSGKLDDVIQMIGATSGGEEISDFLWTSGISWARMRNDIQKNVLREG